MIQSLKAIIVKELRENLPWAGVILIATSGLLVMGLVDQFNMGMSVLGHTFLLLCMLMYPTVGLSLGLLQIFQDSRKGRWQFVSHRPVSRHLLLAGKVIAGLCLYLTATLLPLLITAWWVSIPGHVAGPFTIDMLEPSLAYLFWGMIWYAAGLLTAARQARWIGSRLVPIGGAVAGSFLNFLFSWTLTESIVLTLLATATLLIGAFGVFRAGGETRRTTIWAKAPIGFALLIGWICIISLCSMMGDTAIRAVIPQSPRYEAYRSYHLAGDGQVQIWTMGINANNVEKNETLTGEPLKLPPHDYWVIDGQSAITVYFPDEATGSKLGYPAVHDGFLLPEKHLIYLGNNWFFVPTSRTILAYSQILRRYSGSLSPAGIAGPEKPAVSFSKSTRYSAAVGSSAFVVSPEAVYAMDRSVPEITKIFSASQDDPVLTATTNEYAKSGKLASSVPTFSVITTRSAFHFLEDGEPPITVPIDYSFLQSNVDVERTADGHLVVAYGLDWPVGTKPVNVSTYDANGKRVNQVIQPITNPHYFDDNSSSLEEVGALTLSPPAFFATVMIIRSEFPETGPWHVYALLMLSAVGYSTIVFTMLRRRHAARSQYFLWLPLAAALGLAGVLLLMSMFEKPRGVRCTSCGKPRFISEGNCRNCGTSTAEPVMEGIEIFEPALCGVS